MNTYFNYVLQSLRISEMNAQEIINSLIARFNLTAEYAKNIFNSLVEQNFIESEFDEDFKNVYKLTIQGIHYLQDYENLQNESGIDYKSLLGNMLKETNDEESTAESPLTIRNQENQTQEVNDTTDTIELYTPINNSNYYTKDFSQYKLNVKKHNKILKYDSLSDDYLYSHKLNISISLISYILFATLTLLSYSIFHLNGIIDSTIQLKFIIFLGLYAIYPILSLFINIFHLNKKVRNIFDFVQCFKVFLLCISICIILIIALNFLFGLNIYNFIRYIQFWLFPCLIAITTLFYPIIKQLLIKTKKFNA